MYELRNIIYVSQSTTDAKPLPVTEAVPKTNHLWKVGQREVSVGLPQHKLTNTLIWGLAITQRDNAQWLLWNWREQSFSNTAHVLCCLLIWDTYIFPHRPKCYWLGNRGWLRDSVSPFCTAVIFSIVCGCKSFWHVSTETTWGKISPYHKCSLKERGG